MANRQRSKAELHESQRRVAKEVLAAFQHSGVAEDDLERQLALYNAAFRRAGLPEINDPCDLVCLINDDATDPATLRLHLEELSSLLGAGEAPADATIGELASKIGSEQQEEALVEKRVAKRRGRFKEQ